MPHPVNNLNRAPSDYNLFWFIAPFLRLGRFDNYEEMEALVKEFFVSNDKNWINELAERWLHSIYNPNLVPSDYYLFWSMAHFLRSQCFNHQKKVEALVNEFFTSNDKNWYQFRIKELAEKWLQTVHLDVL